jgi:geranylgeranyl diphosphate synthase, type I
LFEQFMQRYAPDLDTTLRGVVASISDDAPGFGVMARYPLGWVNEFDHPHLYPTGKRIRPLFLLLCTEAAGGNWRQALPAAAAVELLHNFSLVHDDIQDDSAIRHGRPTVWKMWGNANAINAGDALFSLAYCALENLSGTGVSPEILVKIWRIFNKTNLELTRGQHLDMRFEKQTNVSVDDYISMITGKSAALLGACAQIGALIATGDDELAEEYASFALNMGIAFQIRDDILGIWGDSDLTGKSTATDIISRKKSLPVLYALTKSGPLAEIYQQAQLSDGDVTKAVSILDSLGAQKYTQETETRFYEKAIQALNQAEPEGEAGIWLRQFVDILFQRSY